MSAISTHLATSHTIALQGLEGVPVKVECHIGPGLVGLTLVGLADTALREAKERVRAALASINVRQVNRRVTVNLSPSGLPKSGAGFDLAIAAALLIAQGRVDQRIATNTLFYAELGLDGSLRAVPGVLPAALAAKKWGFDRIVVSPTVAAEAALVTDLQVVPCANLADLVRTFQLEDADLDLGEQFLWDELENLAATREPSESQATTNGRANKPPDTEALPAPPHRIGADLSQVRGQEEIVRALAIAAVGRHHVLLKGPQGVGKTMLATRLPDLLPDLDPAQSLAATALRSLSDWGTGQARFVVRPPVEMPHHSMTVPALVGGGSPVRPGAVSLAHGGVLVLDEAPEFQTKTLEALRQPLENAEVAIYRAKEKIVFPAEFQMIMTANPCPCGGGSADTSCTCSFAAKKRYWSRLSGPLLDRVDMVLEVGLPQGFAQETNGEPVTTEGLRQAVEQGRARTLQRLKGTPWRWNAQVPGSYLRSDANMAGPYLQALDRSIERGEISMRGADRVLRVAWSSADLAGRESPGSQDLAFALQMRGGKGSHNGIT